MLRRSIITVAAVCTGLLLSAAAASSEPVFPRGLRIGLTPPGDMVVSKRFSGFEDFDRKSAITILDLPARAYQDLQRSAFAPDQKGVTGIKRESFPFASGIGLLVSGTAQENGGTVHKWFLMAAAIGGEVHDLATLVSVQVPEPSLTVYSEAIIRKALASVTFRPTPTDERLSLLPFKFDNLAGFRVLQVLPAGGVILTDGPSDDITSQPYMIVSAGPGAPSDANDRGRFARELLATAPLANLRIQLAEPMRITGASGYEIRAQAQGPRGAELSLVQWVRFSGSGYLRIIGVTPKDDWNPLFTRFRAVRDGIDFR